jgi:hypothetical protein
MWVNFRSATTLIAAFVFFGYVSKAQEIYLVQAKFAQIESFVSPIQLAIADKYQNDGDLSKLTSNAADNWTALGFTSIPISPINTNNKISEVSVNENGVITVTVATGVIGKTSCGNVTFTPALTQEYPTWRVTTTCPEPAPAIVASWNTPLPKTTVSQEDNSVRRKEVVVTRSIDIQQQQNAIDVQKTLAAQNQIGAETYRPQQTNIAEENVVKQYLSAVAAGKVKIGMTQAEVISSVGYPTIITNDTAEVPDLRKPNAGFFSNKTIAYESWQYGDKYSVTFTDNGQGKGKTVSTILNLKTLGR